MISVGDLITFSGNYVIENNQNQEIVMTSLYRNGSVLEISKGFIRVFSENEICILSQNSNGACLIKKIL